MKINANIWTAIANKICLTGVTTFLLCLTIGVSHAAPRDQAKRIHDRLAASPPSEAVLNSMTQKIANGDAVGAAMEAMENKGFYNIFLKNYITPWLIICST